MIFTLCKLSVSLLIWAIGFCPVDLLMSLHLVQSSSLTPELTTPDLQGKTKITPLTHCYCSTQKKNPYKHSTVDTQKQINIHTDTEI